MSLFDIVLLLLLAGFVLSGLFKGLIRMLGHVVGLIFGAYVASHYYLAFHAWWSQWFDGRGNLGRVISFIILFIVVTQLVDWLFILVEKAFKLIAFIPGSRFINNILGAILGFLEGALFLGLIIYVISRYAVVGHFFGDLLAGSVVAPWLLRIVNLIIPVLPEALRALQSII